MLLTPSIRVNFYEGKASSRMPTKLPQVEGDENHVAVSEGSEHVVQIKRMSRRVPQELDSAVEHFSNVANSREFLHDEKSMTEGIRRVVQPRRGTPIGASLFQEVGRQKRVTSILEIDVPQMGETQSATNRTSATVISRHSDPDTAEIVESDDETRIIDSMRSEKRSYTEVRTKKQVAEHANLENSNVRYSNIFVPELTKKHKNKRVPWRHRSSGRSMRSATAVSCSCNHNVDSTCVHHLCRRCNPNPSLSDLKATSHDHSPYGQQKFACSLENLHHQHRQHSNHHGSQRNCLLCQRSNISMENRRFLQSYSADSLSRRMYSSDAIYDMYTSNTILNRNADLLEIEYEEALNKRDLEGESYLTPEKLRIFIKVASETVLMEETDLDKASKTLKLALDDKFGVNWHVIISYDTYGSNVATLPGALVNFKHGKNVILAWQT